MLHTLAVGDDLDAHTVVFLHGLFGQGRNFMTIAKALQPSCRSVLIDLPDHGRSDWTDAVDLVAMADAVADTVRDLGVLVHLVGHSLGGKVAMLVALRHPELLRSLVVVDIAPAPSHDVSEFEQLLGALATVDLDRLESRGQAEEQLQPLIPNPTVRGFLLQNLHRGEHGWAWRANLDLLRRSLDVVGSFPDVGAARYPGPVLWVVGERSHYTSDQHSAAMRALFPRTTRVSIKGAGHWVHSEQPESFTAVLSQFLARAG